MHIDKIRQLASWMAAANLSHLELRSEGFDIRLVRPLGSAPAHPASAGAVAAAAPAAAPAVAAMATFCGHFHARHPSRTQAQASPGQALAVGDVVGVIAVGGLLLPVTVHTAGNAGAYLVEDGQLVDYATPLLALAGD